MAEKSAKKKTKKAPKPSADASVMGNLRSTRPTRLGGERRAATRTRAAAPAKTSAAAKTSAPKSSARVKPTARKTSAPKQAEAKAARLRKPAPAPPAGWQTPSEDGRRPGGPPRGTELVTTAVQAAGEVAGIGVTLLRRAVGRIRRP